MNQYTIKRIKEKYAAAEVITIKECGYIVIMTSYTKQYQNFVYNFYLKNLRISMF